MKARSKWQDWMALILGVWVFLSPWTFGGSGSAAWAAWILGILVVAMALWALSAPQLKAPEWTLVALGAALFVSPWILDFAIIDDFTLSTWIVGIVIIMLAIWVIYPVREEGQKGLERTGVTSIRSDNRDCAD